MKISPRYWLLPALVVLVAGCLTGRGGSTRREPDLLVWENLREYQSYNGYYAIQRLRPLWLNARRAGSQMVSPATVGEGQIQVYIDNILQEGSPAQVLSGLRVGDIEEMRRLSAGDATTRFGTDHTGGAILVTTKAG